MRTQTQHLPETLYSCKAELKVAGKILGHGDPLEWKKEGLTIRKVMQMLDHRMLTPQRPPEKKEPKAKQKRKR